MTSQRFCLRWNNHQSNLLSVFDQLLHAETFTDVTLAVEGQYLKAHKMVLSACSPYFNALFVNHPEKHPIVILKDVPYADMKSLLDFMYRGEVSVDQERLTAFLRVAESLRIKGLTEVNDDKPLGPANTPPPPQLHRIQPYLVQQRKTQGMLMNSSPLLGSALSMPKRKRGRPRKLSGSSNGTGNDFDDYDRENLVQGSPEMLEVKMGTEGYSGNEGSDDNNHREPADNDHEHNSNQQEQMDTSDATNKSQSKEVPAEKDNENSTSEHNMNNSPELTQRLLGYKPDLDSKTSLQQKLKLNPLQPQSSINTSNSLLQQQLQNDSLNNNNPSPNTNIVLAPPPQSGDLTTNSPASSLQHPYLMHMSTVATSSSSQSDFYKRSPKQSSGHCGADSLEGVGGVESASGIGECRGNTTSNDPMSPTLSGMTKPPQRRRIRRKATSSPDDQAEHLTEMSVRGLDLFRYASITEGVYQCTECAKENVQKTFKNKYSFQRHAFLYHEGKHRKVFPCPVCGKEFSRPDKMKNHMKTTHECYIPKEVNYHPLNYLITAAAAGEIQQIFPQLESSNAAVPPTTTVSPIKIDKLPLKPENSYNIKSEPPPTPTTESSISLKETEEVK